MDREDPRTGPVEVVPKRQGWTVGQIAGVAVGAVMLGVTGGCLLAYAILDARGWVL